LLPTGNIGSQPTDLEPVTLETPTLKSEVYTTGRGGSGNMAKNNDPDAARRAQDVVATPRRESTNSTHVGRGGAANVFRPSAAEIEAAKKDNAKWESAISDDKSISGSVGEKQRTQGLADKGKEWLNGKVGGKK
jgi:hypothetical protein